MVTKNNSYQNTALVTERTINEEMSLKNIMPYIEIEVPEIKAQLAQVIYRDVDKNNQHLTSSKIIKGEAGKQINYSTSKVIKHFMNKGYVLKNNGFDPEGQIHYFDNNDATLQTFYVDLRHDLIKVTPENPGNPNMPINDKDLTGPRWGKEASKSNLIKDVTCTINYIDDQNNQLAEPIIQVIRFTQSGTLDKVTGKWATPLKWEKSSDVLSKQVFRDINGYHIVKINKNFKVNSFYKRNSKVKNFKIDIVYTSNKIDTKSTRVVPSVQKIRFADEDGNDIAPANVQESVFIYTGDTVDKITNKILKTGIWNQQSYTYNAIELPVIEGYVAKSGYYTSKGKKVAGGLTATYSNPNVQLTVVYKKSDFQTHADVFKETSILKNKNYKKNYISEIELVGLSGIK